MSLEMKYIYWERKYYELIQEYNIEREQTDEYKNRLADKQERYIQREQEYREVIEDLK